MIYYDFIFFITPGSQPNCSVIPGDIFYRRSRNLAFGTREFKMKKLLFVTLVIAAVIVLGSCGQGDKQAVDGLISKGDRIGNISYTTGEVGQFTPLWDLKCTTTADGITSDCTAEVGQKVNLSAGIYKTLEGKSLDEMWADQDYGLTVGELPIDLQSFGYVELEHPVVRTIRMWNVVVTTDKPGNLTFVDSGSIGGMTMNYITTINFVEPED